MTPEGIVGPTFRPFDPTQPVPIYRRALPHWRQVGATYFITFRQADSIPQTVLAEWLDDRDRWLRANGIDPEWMRDDTPKFDGAYAVIPADVRRAFERRQARMLHDELDRCHGSCLLRQREPRIIVEEALRHFHGSRCWVGDFVVMPNHVHWLVQPLEGCELEELFASVKKWTAGRIGTWMRESGAEEGDRGRCWQHESYDRIVRDAEELGAHRRYIAANPMKANLRDAEYTCSQADWLDRFADRTAHGTDSESRATSE